MTRAAAGAGSLAERIRSAASLVPLEPLSVMASVATAVFRGVQAFSNYRKGAGPSPGNGHGAG